MSEQEPELLPSNVVSNPNDGDYHSLSMAYQTYLRHDQAEQNHWDEVCRAFRQYATFAMSQWDNQMQRLSSLPPTQRMVLPLALRRNTTEYNKRAQQYKDASIRNQFCLDCILRHAGMPHSQQIPRTAANFIVSDSQMSRVSSVLKSLARDWSADGKAERDMSYLPILEQMQAYMPIRSSSKLSSSSRQKDGGDGKNKDSRANAPRVCVPGAGVGRLALELCAAGYRVQGNEFSLYMLLASDFILNGGVATPEQPLSISPWLLESRNVHTSQDQVRVVTVPDVDPYTMLADCQDDEEEDKEKDVNDNSKDNGDAAAGTAVAKATTTVTTTATNKNQKQEEIRSKMDSYFSMAAGDFAMIYGHAQERGQWDAVVCCFFLDAAPSIVEYIQIIYRMLRHGGILVNFGPLLYHWSGPAMRPDDKSFEDYQARFSYLDSRYMNSVDLSWEDVRDMLMNVGFEILEENPGQRALYTADRKSMMNLGYRCINFVARKKREPGSKGDLLDSESESFSDGEDEEEDEDEEE